LFHLVCYVRNGDHVFETYWTTRRGAEAMDYSYALMDLTVYGRQEAAPRSADHEEHCWPTSRAPILPMGASSHAWANTLRRYCLVGTGDRHSKPLCADIAES
jgi:predicted dithiol-disulfide oxidoreductase (DUF899 family)